MLGPSTIAPGMLLPLLTMMLATKFYYLASLFGRVRTDLLDLESGKDWVQTIASGSARQ